MGFHACEYCEAKGFVPEHSSGDVTLVFDSGRSYVVPDMLVHYMLEHGYVPPREFIEDVSQSKLVGGGRQNTKALPTSVGYLKYPEEAHTVFDVSHVPPKGPTTRLSLIALVSRLVREAAAMRGGRVQTRGFR